MKIRLILPVLAFFMAGTISAAGADGIRKTESSEDREMDRFISALMRKMTLEEKVGQMVQIPANFTTGPAVRTGNYIKSIEEGRVGSMLNVEGVAATRKYQELAMKSRLRIPLIFGTCRGLEFRYGGDRAGGTMCSPGGFGCRDTLDICAHG